MRVVVNQLAALGQKTGIGLTLHVPVAPLLGPCSEPGEIAAYPEGWLVAAAKRSRIRPYLEGSRPAGQALGNASPRVRWGARMPWAWSASWAVR